MSVIGHGVEIVTSATRPASPFDGMQIYETDTRKMLVYNSSAWVEVNDLDNLGAAPAAIPRGLIAETKKTVTQNFTSSSPADVTGLSLTWTAESNRLYLLALNMVCAKDFNPGIGSISITDASNNVKATSLHTSTSAFVFFFTVYLTTYETGLSGSQTRKVRVATTSSNLDAPTASVTQPATFMVFDMGVA